MKQKTVWLVLSVLIALVMVLVSCQQTTTEEEGTTVTGKVTEVKRITETPPVYKAEAEKPQYGGSFIFAREVDILGFDEAFTAHYNVDTLHLTNEELLSHDMTRGPAGTGEFMYQLGGVNRLDMKMGCLAETWEIPQKGTMIFHIRHGVKFQNKPPTNGRELTAADVVYSLKRVCTEPRSYIKLSYPAMVASVQITATGDTVTLTCSEAEFGNMTSMLPDYVSIIPHEVVEQYGDMRDWKNSCGTGPYMLTDFVSGGSATLQRNPDYWMKDPVGSGKGNQLPYLDTVVHYIIPDMATRYTALRTGKADWCGVTWDEAAKMRQTNPEIKWAKFIHDTAYVICMRTDKADSPFSKLKVRQALTLGVDYKTLKDVFYGGDAEIMTWPVVPCKEYANSYIPLEQYPADVQELYSYNPEKARTLLTEAGYPTGFPATVICYNTATQVDVMSQIQAMWKKIGVTLTIDARDYAVWVANLSGRNYTDMLYYYTAGIGTAWKMINFNGVSMFNGSYVNDATVLEAYTKIQGYMGIDEKKIDETFRNLLPYLISQCYVIQKTSPYTYYFWQPWIKNYYGGGALGYYDYYTAPRYAWVDSVLKKQLLGK